MDGETIETIQRLKPEFPDMYLLIRARELGDGRYHVEQHLYHEERSSQRGVEYTVLYNGATNWTHHALYKWGQEAEEWEIQHYIPATSDMKELPWMR